MCCDFLANIALHLVYTNLINLIIYVDFGKAYMAHMKTNVKVKGGSVSEKQWKIISKNYFKKLFNNFFFQYVHEAQINWSYFETVTEDFPEPKQYCEDQDAGFIF